jgi:hypothetical protein
MEKKTEKDREWKIVHQKMVLNKVMRAKEQFSCMEKKNWKGNKEYKIVHPTMDFFLK